MDPTHQKARSLEYLLPRLSPANREGLVEHLAQMEANEGMKPASLYSFAKAVHAGDQILSGKSFLAATPKDYLRVIQGFKAIYSTHSVRQRVVCLRKHVRWVHRVDAVAVKYGQVPPNYPDIERALTVKREKEQVVGQVIRPEDFALLLAFIPERDCLKRGFPMQVRDRAMLAVLRASGLRGGELVSLRIKDVGVEEGVARLALSQDSATALAARGGDGYLKTGPRTIFIKDGASELAAWLQVHPDAVDPDAPLWVNADRTEATPFTTPSLRKLLRKAVAWAGIAQNYPAALTPHDFRHTCATEKASPPLNWNEPQLCQFFGWAPGSRTPATYVHLTLQQQRQRIIADAQARANAIATAAPAQGGQVQALVALMAEAMKQLGPLPAASAA